MKTRRYIFYSVVYIALVWVMTFSFINQDFSVNLFEYNINLPIATWIIIPITLFALLSILHMSYYGFKNFLDARAVKNDLQLYNTLAQEIYLGLESNKDFKTDLFLSPSEITKSLSPWVDLGEPNLKNEELKSAYEISKKVKNGEACDIKKFKILKTNPLFLQNEKNKIKADYKYAITLISSKNEINDAIYKEAYSALINFASYIELCKFNFAYTNDDIFSLVKRYVKNENFEIASSELFTMINKNEFSCDEYIKLAILLKTKLDPDKLISMFDRLKNEHSNAMEAYLYILYDLQMLDKLRESLASIEHGDFDKIKTLLFLRESGRLAPVDMFYK
ncbi:hypothetical protein P9I23_000972 [Campylobacter fetus]|nr:hypothetical protein [Campylobacter fetus]